MPNQPMSHAGSLLQGSLSDVRYALRIMRRNWVVMGVALLTIALAIGANTAIFTLLNALLLQQLPVREPKELVQIVSTFNGKQSDVFSVPAVQALQDAPAGLSGLFAVSSVQPLAAGPAAGVERARAVWVSGQYFFTLGLQPAAGRLLVPADDLPNAPPVAVASFTYWQQRLGGRLDAIGQPIVVLGHPVTVVGVAPRGFVGITVGQSAELTMPLATLPQVMPSAASRFAAGTQWLRVFARVPSGTTIDQAGARLASLWPGVSERAVTPTMPPQRQKEIRAAAISMRPGGAGWSPFRSRYAEPLYVLMGGVALVLLIAYGNVAHLLLARATARSGEMSMRLAIGASRMRLVRQLFIEGLLLTAGSAILGLAIAYGVSRLILSVMAVGQLDTLGIDITPNARVFAFSLGLAALIAIGLGAVVAWGVASMNPASLMTGQSMRSTKRHSWAAGWLVAGQLALSLMLLVGAALFVQTLRNFDKVKTGFTADGVLLIRVDPSSVIADRPGRAQVFQTILSRIRAIPGVTSASVSKTTPLSGFGWTDGVRVIGGKEFSEDERQATVNAVSSDYFKTLSTRLISGRDFTEADVDGAPKVVIVSQSFARRHLGDEPPVGRVLSFDPGPPELKDLSIVGVVEDTIWANLKSAAPPSIYVPFFQQIVVLGASTVEVRTNGSFAQIASDARAIVRQALPTIDVTMVAMADEVRGTFMRERLLAMFASGFALLALLLSAVGLYALTTLRVTQRTREIAVRMAIGAKRQEVIAMVLRDATTPIAIGVVIGLLGSWWGSRYLTSLMFGLAATDIASGVVMTLVLFAVGVVAAYLPARRAATIDPNLILRGGD
jgi:putative ABC transport system permease protein